MAPAPQGRRRTSALTWIAVAVVTIVVATFVVIRVTRDTNVRSLADTPAPASLVHEVTTPNMNVANEVSHLMSSSAVSPLTVITGQPTLSLKGKPDFLYVGAEFCPFCAAERWAVAVALGRFGTLSGLELTTSSNAPGETDPNTPTLTFVHARYSSPYVTFEAVETQNRAHQTLQKMSARQSSVFSKYDQNSYLPANEVGYPGSIPFLDIGNRYFQAGSNFSPSVLSGLTQSTIAGGLANASSPLTQEIVGTANEITAAICSLTHEQPSTVCRAAGITSLK